MSDIRLAGPRPQQPQATPGGKGIACLILGIVGLTMLPVIGGILAIIFGRISTRDRASAANGPARWPRRNRSRLVGLIGPLVTVALLFFTAIPIAVCVAIVALILAISVLVIFYVRRDNRS